MTDMNVTGYFNSKVVTDPQKRRYAQNSLIVDTAVAIDKALEIAGLSQKDLAQRLGKTEGYVSQVLSGGANLTLRTLADFAYGLNCSVDIGLSPVSVVSITFPSQDGVSWTQVRAEPAEPVIAAGQELPLAA